MAKTNSNKIIDWIVWLYFPIFLVVLGFNCWWVYYKMVLQPNVSALETSFINDATYSGDEQRFFMEVQIYDNVVEWKWNYYVDTSLPEQNEDGTYDSKYMFSTGIQFYSQNRSKNFSEERKGGLFRGTTRHWYEARNCTFYSTPDGIDYGYTSPNGASLADQNSWVYDIGGKLCKLVAIGDVQYDKILWKKHTMSYDPIYLIYSNFNSALTFEEGTTITYFDMSKFFKVAMYNEETGKFGEENVGVDEDILEELTFIAVKVTKYDRDMVSAQQSLFKSYKGDTNWEADGSDSSLQYWQDKTVYTVTASDFSFEPYQNSQYYIKLKSSCILYLSDFEDLVIKVDINLEDFGEVKVVGFSDEPFGELAVYKINISSDNLVTFSVPQNTWDLTTPNVNISQRGIVV